LQKTIRLATLLPGGLKDPLRIILSEHKLDDESLEYQALSYCWGDGRRECPINCEEGTVLVMSNLVAALRRLRRLSDPLLL
jgi:hypothetical protein